MSTLESDLSAYLGARRESSLLREVDLTRDQLKAVSRAHDILNDIGRAADSFKVPAGDASWLTKRIGRADAERAAQVILIDGARGSGKTSVLLHMHRRWRGSLEARPGGGTSPTAEPPRGASVPRLTVPVLPLPILDLQPVPQRAQLAALLLGLFEPLHEELEQVDHSRRVEELSAWMPTSVRGRAAPLPRLREDIFRAVAAWTGHAIERQRHLEADVFWRDLADESALLAGFQSRFRKYVDQLIEELAEHLMPERRRPVLVVPIDDADMNPRRCGELIELLRALYHPRVVFLLTGDTELFDTVLRRHMLGSLWDPLRQLPNARSFAGMVDQDRYVAKVARDAYDRVIPPSHRLQLRPIAERDRWPAPDAPSTEVIGAARSLRTLFARVPTSPWPYGLPLCSYLEPPRATDQRALGARLPGVLPDRMRDLHDRITQLVQLDPTLAGDARTSEEPALEAARREPATSHPRRSLTSHALVDWLWGECLSHAILPPSDARWLRGVVSLEEGVGGERALVVYGDKRLRWRSEARTVRARTGSDPRTTIEVRLPASMRLHIRNRGEPLSESVADTLRLAVDVAAERGSAGFVGDAPSYPRDVGLHAATRLELFGVPPITLPWLLPPWHRFLTVAWFTARWRYLIETERQAEVVVRDFINAAIDAPRLTDPLEASTAAWKDRLWPELQSLWIAEEMSASDETERSLQWFRHEALVLLAPEHGLPEVVAGSVFESLGSQLTRERAQRLKLTRDGALRRALDPLAPEQRAKAVGELGDLERDHPFMDVIQSALSRTSISIPPPAPTSSDTARFGAGSKGPFKLFLERIGVPHERGHFVPGPFTLLGYANATRARAELLRTAEGAMDEGLNLLLERRESSAPREVTEALLSLAAARAGRTLPSDQGAWRDALFEVPQPAAGLVFDPYPPSPGLVWMPGSVPVFGSQPVTPEEALLALSARLWLDLRADRTIGGRWVAWAWHGVLLRREDGTTRLLPWPDPGFVAPIDHELLNEGCGDILTASTRPEADAAAWAFVQLVESVARQRTTGDVHQAPYEPTQWAPAISRLLHTHRTEVGLESARWHAFDAWRARVALLATPECGLSHEAARVVLETVGAHERASDRHDVYTRWREWRAERWRDTHADRPLPSAAGHPWGELVERTPGALEG